MAMGFECPLHVPLAAEPEDLTRARHGDGNRPWSAGAGCGALTTGLVQTVWILREIRRLSPLDAVACLDWPTFAAGNAGLFVWEAFVSGDAKGQGHSDDARLGVAAFQQALPSPRTCIKDGAESYSLIGAALLRSGWSQDLSLLSQPSLVVRATAALLEPMSRPSP